MPAGKKTRLVLDVSHHPQGDYRLLVRADGKVLHDSIVGPETAPTGWVQYTIDLSPLAGQTVKLEVVNEATGWNWEFAYWSRVEVLSE